MVLRGLLRFLGGVLVLLLVLGIILGVAGFLAVRNFDPNMFRAEFEKAITQQTGFRVELGDIKLQWKLQPRLQVAGLKFYHPKSLEKILQSDEVLLDADLASIGQKYFKVSQIVIQNPEIFLKRSPEGMWNWQVVKETPDSGLAVASPVSRGGLIPSAEASEGTGSIPLKSLDRVTQGWKFGIGKIFVHNAAVHFTDETVEPVYKLEIEKLEAEVLPVFGAPVPGSFHFTAAGSVFNSGEKNLTAEGDLDLASRSLDILLRYGPEKVVFQGRLKSANAMPYFEGTLEIRDLDMESVIPEIYRKNEHVAGRLGAQANISFEGANPATIKRSLQGKGTVEIVKGALKNRNLIKEVFDRLSPVLAVASALGGELPPEMNEMLRGRDTPFQSLRVAYEVRSGIVRVGEFRLAHPNYLLSGRGTYAVLDNRVDSSLQLCFSQSISGYLIKKIHEMQWIADRNGQITIPFRYSGVFPNASVQPDLGYIGSRLLQSGTDQLLNRGLEQLSKYLERKKNK